ncbi:MAG: DUF1467 family protein [Geminicoccaceae bacterium]
MNVLSTALIFLVSWWLILFMVLPFGAAPSDEVVQGTVKSAPAKPRLLIKFLITTVLAIGATVGIQWLLQSGLIDLRPPQTG